MSGFGSSGMANRARATAPANAPADLQYMLSRAHELLAGESEVPWNAAPWLACSFSDSCTNARAAEWLGLQQQSAVAHLVGPGGATTLFDALSFMHIQSHAHRRQLDLGHNGEYLTGDIAVLSAYNRQLSPDEVEALAQAYSCRFNFVTKRE